MHVKLCQRCDRCQDRNQECVWPPVDKKRKQASGKKGPDFKVCTSCKDGKVKCYINKVLVLGWKDKEKPDETSGGKKVPKSAALVIDSDKPSAMETEEEDRQARKKHRTDGVNEVAKLLKAIVASQREFLTAFWEFADKMG